MENSFVLLKALLLNKLSKYFEMAYTISQRYKPQGEKGRVRPVCGILLTVETSKGAHRSVSAVPSSGFCLREGSAGQLLQVLPRLGGHLRPFSDGGLGRSPDRFLPIAPHCFGAAGASAVRACLQRIPEKGVRQAGHARSGAASSPPGGTNVLQPMSRGAEGLPE